MELQIWTEKYRPQKFSEVINQKHVVERVKAFVKDNNIPHILFAGPAGTGKTSLALTIARELYGKDWKQNVLEMNASDERGIDVMRSKAEQKDEAKRRNLTSIKDFAKSKPFGNASFRIIILDEADALTQDAQHALRRTMEKYSDITRFILICNYSSKIIEPIQSRCAIFRFKALINEDIKKFIERIVEGEKLKIDMKAVEAIVYLSEGDLRKVSNYLQASAAVGEKITENIVYDVSSKAKPRDVKDMMELALKGKFSEARKKLQELLLVQGLAGGDIISEIHKQVYSLDGLSEENKVKLIDKCGEYEFRISEGGNELIQLEALLAQFMIIR